MRQTGLFLIVLLCLPAGALAEVSDCVLLARMRQADAGLRDLAAGHGGAAQIALTLSQIAAEGRDAAVRSTVPGLDAGFVARFTAARREALEALTRGAGPTVLANPALQQTAARAARFAAGLDCATEGRDLDAEGSQDDPDRTTNDSAETAGETPNALGADAETPSLRGGGDGQAARPARSDRVATSPQNATALWTMVSVLLLLASLLATLVNLARRSQRRRERRYPCTLDVAIHEAADRPRLARLVDLSCEGAKLRLAEPPQSGARITLSGSALHIAARVEWSNAHFAGLTFDRPLSLRARNDILGRDPQAAGSQEPEPVV